MHFPEHKAESPSSTGKSSALRRGSGSDPISMKNACLISSTATYFYLSKSMRVGKDCVLCQTFVILSDKCYRRNDQRAAEEVPLGRGSLGASKYRMSASCEVWAVTRVIICILFKKKRQIADLRLVICNSKLACWNFSNSNTSFRCFAVGHFNYF